MKMSFIAAAVLLGLASAPAHAITMGFDSLADGDDITGRDLGGVSITADGLPIVVVDVVASAGLALPQLTVPTGFSFNNSIASNPLTSPEPYRADFSVRGVTKVSVGLGDFGADQDDLFLRAYDLKDTLLDVSTAVLGQGVFAFLMLSVESATEISYVQFGSTGDFANSVFADDLSFSIAEAKERVPQVGTVPVPPALPLMAGGLGLMGLIAWRRKRKTHNTK